MGISERIRQARIAAGLSQTRLAELLGVTRSACSQWESEEGTSPRGKRLAELAQLLGVGYEWLATGHHSDAGHQYSEQSSRRSKKLNAQQQQLLILFERLPATGQASLLGLLESLSKTNNDNNKESGKSVLQPLGSRSSRDDENHGTDS